MKIMGKAPSDVLKKWKKSDKPEGEDKGEMKDDKKSSKKNALLSFIAKNKKK